MLDESVSTLTVAIATREYIDATSRTYDIDDNLLEALIGFECPKYDAAVGET